MCWAKFCGRKCSKEGSLTLWLGRQNVLTEIELLKELEERNYLTFQWKGRKPKSNNNTKQKETPQTSTMHQRLCAVLLRGFSQTLTCSFIRLCVFLEHLLVWHCAEHKGHSAVCLEDACHLVGKLKVIDRLSASVMNAEFEVGRECLAILASMELQLETQPGTMGSETFISGEVRYGLSFYR